MKAINNLCFDYGHIVLSGSQYGHTSHTKGILTGYAKFAISQLSNNIHY